MILNVRVVPKAGRNLIKKEESVLRVYMTSPAQGGRANAQLIGLLSDYLRVKKYQIRIAKGHKTRDKLVEIDT